MSAHSTLVPLVTCLCLTRNRREFLSRAIECFRAQDYPKRELLVVADGDDVSDLVPAGVRMVRCPDGLNIGAKRNFGCERASGQVIAVLDDDDWSAPERVTDQVARLITSRKSVTGYNPLKFTDGERWWKYEQDHSRALGTSLCFWRDWWSRHPFQEFQIGEDDLFSSEAFRAGELVTADGGDMLHVTIHDGNTARKTERALSGPGWTRIS